MTHVSQSARLSILHVSKFPPSPSGIGLYADTFSSHIAQSADVTRLSAPSRPEETQSFQETVRFRGRALRDIDTGEFDLIHVELSGRSLAEFYLAQALLDRGESVSLTLHDLPSVVGSPTLFRETDRRPWRTLMEVADTLVGKALVKHLISAASAVFALTEEGAREASITFGRRVEYLGHATKRNADQKKTNTVFVPGYLGTTEHLTDIVGAMAQHRDKGDDTWNLLLGSCTPSEAAKLAEECRRNGVPFATTGNLSEADLLRVYAGSRIVVRALPRVPRANLLAASGPIAWGAASGALVLTNDTRAGASEFAARGLIGQTQELGMSLRALLKMDTHEIDKRSEILADRTERFFGPKPTGDRFFSAVNDV